MELGKILENQPLSLRVVQIQFLESAESDLYITRKWV